MGGFAVAKVAGVAAPEGFAGEAALALCAEYTDAALMNHSVRSYFFGAAYADARGLVFDRELLFVSALLHDFGLVAAFDSHRLPFEEAGGHVARVFGAGLGWPVGRRDRACEVIVRHMREDVAAEVDVESHLLQVGTSADVSGLGLSGFGGEFTAELMARYPREGFGAVFLELVRDQGARKPECSAAAWVAGGAAERIAANPLEQV
ncbi:HD domain-containing protein [Yinghuangia soli]|uniref:HD domain-containing protein n=1 Tax=Yinghuangia soli TaxID=2908204 RepID=A0AA41Q3E5_9ACTN|nr:HD domain-containing protein [Yinghuangia soli]MCF2530823.1 HD domain-containing protein [Yinghuangia soli]